MLFFIIIIAIIIMNKLCTEVIAITLSYVNYDDLKAFFICHELDFNLEFKICAKGDVYELVELMDMFKGLTPVNVCLYAGDKVEVIRDVCRLKRVKRLIISGWRSIINIEIKRMQCLSRERFVSWLRLFDELKNICFIGLNLEDLLWVGFEKIRRVRIEDCSMCNLRGVERLEQLRELVVTGCMKSNNYECAFECERLRRLVLERSFDLCYIDGDSAVDKFGDMRDAPELQSNHTIRSVRLIDFRDLRGIEALGKCWNLRKVYFEWCLNLVDLEPLKKCKRLRVVKLNDTYVDIFD